MPAFFFRNMFAEQLVPFWQYQGAGHPTGCGPYAVAMALNLADGGTRRGDQVEIELEKRWLKPKGYGIPAWAYRRALQKVAGGLRTDARYHAVLPDLKSALHLGSLVIVAVSWQTNREIFRLLFKANPGHYMVFVGHDDEIDRLYFLDPGDPLGAFRLREYTHAEFSTWWTATSNLFIPRGSMFTLATI